MAVSNSPRSLNLSAAADLSTKQYYLVKQTSDTACNLSSAATDKVLGSLQNKPRSGETAEIAVEGNFKVILGGTVAVGAPLVSDSNGKAVSATQATAGAQPGSWVFAVARQAGVLGDIIEVEGAKIIY